MKQTKTSITKSLTGSPTVRRYLLLILAGFGFAVAARFFIIYANIFSPGIAGVSQGITYTIYEGLGGTSNTAIDYTQFSNSMYWVVYGALNIPIMFFTYIKFGKKFFLDSMLVMVMSLAMTMILTYVPGISDAELIPSYNPMEPISSDPAMASAMEYTVVSLSGLFGGIIYGLSVGLVFHEGASSMGFDPIAKYLQRDKQLNLARVLFWFSFINSLIWIFVTESMAGTIHTATDFWNVLISPRMLGTILFLVSYSLIGNLTSKDKQLRVEINSKHSGQVAEWINSSDFPRSFTIRNVIGGYSKEERQIIDIIMFKSELNDFLKAINEIDEYAFITTSPIEDIYGNFKKISSNKYEKAIEEHRMRRRKAKNKK